MLRLVVYKDTPNALQSEVYKYLERDKFGYLNCNDHNVRHYFGEEFPRLDVDDFYKGIIKTAVYRGDNIIFVNNAISAKDLGRLEHAIYHLTGKRGVGHHINVLEFLAPVSSQLNKFLMKRV
ncbi:hypothetical protein [Salmonella phage vB_SenM_SB18]|uniref:Uncharacterized protein n=1 Tax=Salmonella phage vB_SenM_SB18 TaxID=2698415 RepID=A0A6B9RJ43_9CAUD|nr:hypothetical protein [Salmonella phage vB_SenM_SB18]